ncbi:MAG: tyrosine-type recombinase/integrase [Pseudomonadota bacterium]
MSGAADGIALPGEAGALLARWLDYLTAVRGRAALTRDAYATAVAGFLRFVAGHTGEAPDAAGLAALTIGDFRAWMAARRQAGLGARAHRRDLAARRGVYAWLEEAEGHHCPALLALATPKAPAGLPRPVPAADATAILETVAEEDVEDWIAARDVAILTLLWSAGLRVSEALGLAWSAAPLGPVLRVTGKGGRVRDVPVIPAAAGAIEAYRRLCPHRPGPDGPLFLATRGGPLRRAAVAEAMARARRALGLPDSATPHALRHAFATEILAGSGDLRAVQALLGHRSLTSTQVYTRIDDARLKATHAAAHPRARRGTGGHGLPE